MGRCLKNITVPISPRVPQAPPLVPWMPRARTSLRLGIALVIALTACATPLPPAPDLTVDDRPVPQTLDYEALVAASRKPVSTIRQRIVDTATSFLGAPAKRGGGTPKGFDCTGFVFFVYERAAQVTLPRKAISPVDLQPADLVYFSVTGSRSFHVGLYLGEGQFIHAPSVSGTVRIESLGAHEWRTRFLGARQILPS